MHDETERLEQLSLFGPDTWSGRTFPELSPAKTERTSERCSKKQSELWTTPFLFLDLRAGCGNLLGPSWEINSPSLGAYWMLGTGVSPSAAVASSLSRILEDRPHPKYYLSRTACMGILRRAAARGKALPPQLREALEMQAGLV